MFNYSQWKSYELRPNQQIVKCGQRPVNPIIESWSQSIDHETFDDDTRNAHLRCWLRRWCESSTSA